MQQATMDAARRLANKVHSKCLCPQLLEILGVDCDEADEKHQSKVDGVQEDKVNKMGEIQVQAEEETDDEWWQEAAARPPLF